MRSGTKNRRRLAAMSFAALCAIVTASCSRSDSVDVGISVSLNQDGSCSVSANVVNKSQYHLNGATVMFGGSSFDIPSVAANSASYSLNVPMPDGAPDPSAHQGGCASVARWIDDRASKATVATCSMEGVTEGDCQHRIAISGNTNYDAMAASEAEYITAKNNALPAGPYVVAKAFSIDLYKSPGTNPSKLYMDDQKPRYCDCLHTFKVVALHKNGRGAVDWYQVSGIHPAWTAGEFTTMSGWISVGDISQYLSNVIPETASDVKADADAMDVSRKQAADLLARAQSRCDDAQKAVSTQETPGAPPSIDQVRALFQLDYCKDVVQKKLIVERVESVKCLPTGDNYAGAPVYKCDFNAAVSNDQIQPNVTASTDQDHPANLAVTNVQVVDVANRWHLWSNNGPLP